MSVLEMYREFRQRFPNLAQAADARHIKVWDSVEDEAANSWFESVAGVVNTEMGTRKQGADLASVFAFFEGKLQSGDNAVKDCIDVSIVENLFWDVQSSAARDAWATMPDRLRNLYLGFHGHPPTTD